MCVLTMILRTGTVLRTFSEVYLEGDTGQTGSLFWFSAGEKARQVNAIMCVYLEVKWELKSYVQSLASMRCRLNS